MLKRLLLIGALFLTSCGYDGSYRYECQDPQNWQSADCNPPLCKVDGACTKDLLGFDPNETTTQETIAP